MQPAAFTDILSAALDESGIGDLDDFDLGFSDTVPVVNGGDYNGTSTVQNNSQFGQTAVSV